MGFRVRKSIPLGKSGVRINISKSGIGGSVGTKGMRVTKMTNGRNRSTVSIPGAGISYVKETSSANKKLNESSSSYYSNKISNDFPNNGTSNARYCPNCGVERVSLANFCSNCGFKFNDNQKNNINIADTNPIVEPAKNIEIYKNAYISNVIFSLITGIYVVLRFLQIFGTYTINLQFLPFIILILAIYVNVINKKIKVSYIASILIYIFSIFPMFFFGLLSLGFMFYFPLILIVVPYGVSAIISITLALGIKQNILNK